MSIDENGAQPARDYDIAVIGGGPGGHAAAVRATKLGARVALMEKDSLGGTCLNRGCIPTKYLARHAALLMEVNAARDMGEYGGDLKANFGNIVANMNRVMQQLRASAEQALRANNVSILHGAARLISPNSIAIEGRTITANNIIIASGSVPLIAPIPGVNCRGVVNTDQMLQMQQLPESIIVIGGNYVGLEFACIMNAFGVKVTVLEKQPSILKPSVEDDISRRFMRCAVKRGMEIVVDADIQEIREADQLTEVLHAVRGVQKKCISRIVLMATGRLPCTDGLGLEAVGIKVDNRAITVNKHLRTSAGNVYAIGDVTGKNMLAHVASYEGEIAADNALGLTREADYRVIPSDVFVTPEIASVGITEAEAIEKKINYRVNKLPMTACSRAVVATETSGIVKMICSADDGALLGLHIMGPHASDLIAEGALAIKYRMTASDIAGVIHAHPSFSEILRDTAVGLAAH